MIKLQTLAMACSADQFAAGPGSTGVYQQTLCISICKINMIAYRTYQRPIQL